MEISSLDTRKEIVQNFDDIEENKPIAFSSNYERYDFLKNQEVGLKLPLFIQAGFPGKQPRP